MENKIKQEAIKEADLYWENNLKKSFKDKLDKSYIEPLNDIKKSLKDFEESLKNHINSLDKEFQNKFNLQVSQLQQQKGFNEDMNMNKIKFDKEINIDNEPDELLRIKKLDLRSIMNPPLKKLIPPENSNNLLNLLLNCIINIQTLISYYFNPDKENKIMRKSNGTPNILGPSFLKLLDHSWKSKNEQYIPKEIHQIMRGIMKEIYNTQNPGLIFQIFLSQLNSELSLNNMINPKNNFENDPYIIFNRERLVELFKMQNNQTTKIQNCFYNILETDKRCTSCESFSYSIDYLPIINIYLTANEENIYNKLSFLNDFKALLIDKNEEKINEDCIICEGPREKFVSKHILDTSQLIIININRNNDPNNMVELNFPEILEKKDFINSEKTQQYYNLKYEIFCIVKKYKINNNFQYLLFCKNFVNNTWYSYNNKDIRKTELNEAISDSKNICLIIYQMKN